MELKVDGIHSAKNIIANQWPTHIISIVNEGGGDFGPSTIDRQHSNHFIFSFHDVEDRNSTDYVVPTAQDIKSILDTAAQIPDDGRLLIHCTAGKSRSTAVAIGVLIQRGMSPQAAFDWVKAHRPAMFPNRLMIEYVDDYLNLDGKLITIVGTYYEEKLLLFPKLVELGRGGYNR